MGSLHPSWGPGDQAQDDEAVDIKLPPKMVELFNDQPGEVWRFRAAYGGRGSAKTRSFALMTAVKGYLFGRAGIQGQILCAREHLNSIDESSLTEIKMAIREHPFLEDYYDIGERYLRSKDGNIEFVFAGLRRNLGSIKSKARILLCWVDEAEAVPESAWMTLIPTVREDDSEVWVSWNPQDKHSATDIRFRQKPSADMKVVRMNYTDNPWFPGVLNRDRLNDLRLRPDTYSHVWEGDYLIYAEGAYYKDEMRRAAEEGRICRVPYDRSVGVTTWWDLGIGDSTAIWFVQHVGQEVRAIDYYETGGVGLDHYAKFLAETGYVFKEHILPHDVEVRELGTGKSRKEILGKLGITNIRVAPNLPIDDGIQAVRSLLGRMWFDDTPHPVDPNEGSVRGVVNAIDRVRQYRREYNEQAKVWNNRPLHNWTSHCADALRMGAVGSARTTGWGPGPIRRNIRGVA